MVFSEWLNGAAVTAAPEFVPSTLNCTLLVFDDTVVVTVTVPDTVASDAGALIEMVGAVALFTVMGTTALVVCPEVSLATAVSEWLPLVSAVVFRVWLNGAAVTAAPEFVPSTLNCTLVGVRRHRCRYRYRPGHRRARRWRVDGDLDRGFAGIAGRCQTDTSQIGN